MGRVIRITDGRWEVHGDRMDDRIRPQEVKDPNVGHPPDTVGYVLFKVSESRTRPTRIVTSRGPLVPTYHSSGVPARPMVVVGDTLVVYSGGKHAGDYEVCGIVRRDNGAVIGDVGTHALAWTRVS